MEENPGQNQPEIPKVLHSVNLGRPFQSCVDCGADLLATGVPYGIEKVVRNGDVVFEYAICATCTFGLVREFSKESLQRMAEWVDAQRSSLVEPDREDLDLFLRALEGEAGDPRESHRQRAEGIDHCQRCGRTGSEFDEGHTVVGILSRTSLITSVSTICSRCTDGMGDILSAKTKDAHDGFVNDNFPGIPADLDVPVGILGL